MLDDLVQELQDDGSLDRNYGQRKVIDVAKDANNATRKETVEKAQDLTGQVLVSENYIIFSISNTWNITWQT